MRPVIPTENHLDLRGLKCPLPVLRTQKQLNRMAPGERVIVACTDPLSVIDIPHMLRQRGDVLEGKSADGGVYVFHIRRDAASKDRSVSAKKLAAVVFEESSAVNGVMADFAAALAARGNRLAGLVQVSAKTKGCECQEVHVLDLASGTRIPILQNLGSLSEACRADSAALAEAAARVRRALAEKPDLVFFNRFGRLESEGKGMREEIGAAVGAGLPVVIGVSVHYRDAWRDFAQHLGEELACDGAALEDWWTRLQATQTHAAVQS